MKKFRKFLIKFFIMIAVIVFVLDVAFESMNTYGIDKIKSLVTSNEQAENTEAGENTTDDVVIDNGNGNEENVVTEVTPSSQDTVQTETTENPGEVVSEE